MTDQALEPRWIGPLEPSDLHDRFEEEVRRKMAALNPGPKDIVIGFCVHFAGAKQWDDIRDLECEADLFAGADIIDAFAYIDRQEDTDDGCGMVIPGFLLKGSAGCDGKLNLWPHRPREFNAAIDQAADIAATMSKGGKS